MSISSRQTAAVYRLRIQLREISPPIWRRLLIPVNSTIADLHQAIQAVMGWEDIHLNRFTIRGQRYSVPREGGMSFSTRPDRLQLIDFGFCEHDRFIYEYEFYSGWIHDILIEKVFDAASASATVERTISYRGSHNHHQELNSSSLQTLRIATKTDKTPH